MLFGKLFAGANMKAGLYFILMVSICSCKTETLHQFTLYTSPVNEGNVYLLDLSKETLDTIDVIQFSDGKLIWKDTKMAISSDSDIALLITIRPKDKSFSSSSYLPLEKGVKTSITLKKINCPLLKINQPYLQYKGSEFLDDFNSYWEAYWEDFDSLAYCQMKYHLLSNDSDLNLRNEFQRQAIKLQRRNYNSVIEFIKKYPQRDVPYAFLEVSNTEDNFLINKADSILYSLPEGLKESAIIKRKYTELENKKVVPLPKGQFSDFSLNSENESIISTRDYRGKYLLIDFWASWCKPCRQEIPEIKLLYDKYKAKNFDILSVSCDRNFSSWKNALLKEQMPWKQVIDYASGDSSAFLKFNIKIIPYNLLLDPNGNLIATDLHEEKLAEKLEHVIK